MIRDEYPIAWGFHRNTALWRHQAGAAPVVTSKAPFKEYATAPLVALPEPGSLRMRLDETIRARLSCRLFRDRALPLTRLSTLLHSAYGVQERAQVREHELLTRPVPSGGGLYPLELYVLARRVQGIAPGIYHYAPLSHGLEQIDAPPLPAARLVDLFLGQSFVAGAAAVVVLTALLERSMQKYADRGYRLILLEAGHVAQNLNLGAAALGWASANLGGFFDQELGAALDLDPDQEVPLYAVAIGKPALADPGTLRQI